jgi:hypothetical protein
MRATIYAVAKVLDTKSLGDTPLCEGLTDKRLFTCLAPILAKLDKDRAKPGCQLSREEYYWTTVEQFHGGQYFTFSRADDGTWRVKGPLSLSHNNNLHLDAP